MGKDGRRTSAFKSTWELGSIPALSSLFRSLFVESGPDKLRVLGTGFGRTPPSGGRGRRFKCSHPDHYLIVVGSTGHTLAYPVFLALEIMVIRCQLAQLLFGRLCSPPLAAESTFRFQGQSFDIHVQFVESLHEPR